MKKKLIQYKQGIDSLTIFSGLKEDTVINNLNLLLTAIDDKGSHDVIDRYSRFVSSLYCRTSDLTDYISRALMEDENFYIKRIAAGSAVNKEIAVAAENELLILQELAELTSDEVKKALDYSGFLPDWTNHSEDFRYIFNERAQNISRTGYGIFAKHSFFRFDDGELMPVLHPDFLNMDQLYKYERQMKLLTQNTEAFLNDRGGNNVLLYGDAGTGKSSSIKAVAAHYAIMGLRMIEIKKSRLYQIPDLLDLLSDNPLKFIIYIDDLSFTGNDDSFSALKATLEGSISGCGSNVLIYATSNRRHLVKETFGDRQGDELHINDTLQETMSLSARFGLTITFQNPDKDEYLSIVKALAQEYDIQLPEDELFAKAEAHALRRNGRSPRTARQFISLLKSGIQM